MPVSNLLVEPNPVNSPFHLSEGALILVFSITPSELVVMGPGLRYQRAVSEHFGCNLPALPSTEEQYQKCRANPPSHIPEFLSKRPPKSLPHICHQNKNADFIFSIGTCQFIWCGWHPLLIIVWAKAEDWSACTQNMEQVQYTKLWSRALKVTQKI